MSRYINADALTDYMLELSEGVHLHFIDGAVQVHDGGT